MDQSEPAIDAEQAEFVQSGVAINAGSCSAARVPSVARAVGCRVAADHRRMTILVCAEQAAALLADLRETGRIAVSFVEPSTHRALQVKGGDVVIGTATPDDANLKTTLCERFMAALRPLGYDADLVRTLMSGAPTLVAVDFAPQAVFSQTPGPRAGELLKAGA